TVGTNAQIFVEPSLVAGSDTVIRNTQGTTWYEIRGLDGNSGDAGLLVRASANSGGNWTDILRATPARIQLDANDIDINGPVDISGTLSWGGGGPIASSDDVATIGSLAAVAFSGDYDDLSNTPTIPPDVSAATFITASDETSPLSDRKSVV